jgi:hypothetical protein
MSDWNLTYFAKLKILDDKILFTSKLGLNLGKKLVKRYVWSIALYGAGTWTLGKVDQNTGKVLKYDAVEGWGSSVGRIV